MTEIQIRPTLANDLPYLIKLDHSATSESVWQLELRRETGQIAASFREVRLPRSISVTFPHDPQALNNEWTKKFMIATAFADEIPVGYVCLMERGASSTAWITDLVVDVAHRRQGIGGALLSSAQSWATERACRRVVFETQAKNVPAIRFAQKNGYDFCGYNDGYYPTQDVALFFGRVLK